MIKKLLESSYSDHLLDDRSGYLVHNSRLEYVPYMGNLFFFNEADLLLGKQMEDPIHAIRGRIGDLRSFELFMQQKGRRPVYDIYACFQPFNEATKALYPFFTEARARLQPGDFILNLWDRSGWTASLLAGIFPEQQIITTWEGNKDVLGYKGFQYWLGEQRNISVVFCDLDKPLPFPNDSIALAVGLDTFHRFDQPHLLAELDRVVTGEGMILFPHVHLTNSEPEPYFDRGCNQRHGRDYAAAFEIYSKRTGRKGYVFSEPGLFRANDIDRLEKIPLVSTPDMEDYNALLAILPESSAAKTLKKFGFQDLPEPDNSYVLVNQLLAIDLHQQKISLDRRRMGDAVGYLLDRHPVYLELLEKANGLALSEQAVRLLYLGRRGYTVGQIREKLKLERKALEALLSPLEQAGVLQVLPVSEAGFRLQQYLSTQSFLYPPTDQHFQFLWQKTVNRFGDHLALVSLQDGSEFTYEDCDEIVGAIMERLQAAGLQAGDHVLICSKIHTEAVFLFWACMQMGIVAVPVSSMLSTGDLEYIQRSIQPKLCFVNEVVFEEKGNQFAAPVVVFDEEEALDCLYFADWLEEDRQPVEAIVLSPESIGVILFTSGSTGLPKGVPIAHGNLFRSSLLVSETFQWEKEDRFFALGGLESMSGLRNAALAPLQAGAAVIVPDYRQLEVLTGIAESIEAGGATILGANPALLRQLVKYSDRIENQLDSIRKVLCTGSNLSPALRTDFKKVFDLQIYNYYGLTETTGICIAQREINGPEDYHNIGKPVDCIAQVVDERGNVLPPETVGELRIFSTNLMQGYLEQPEQTALVLRNGWFYTHDLAKMQEDGAIQLLGRKRAILKTSTEELIYLQEVENALNALDVVDTAIVRRYVEEDVEKMIAFVVPIDQKDEPNTFKEKIRQQLAQQLGAHKVPNRIQLKPHLDYSDNGKLMEKDLLDALSKRN